MLGLAESYTPFDEQLIIHINSVLFTLSQIGIGPEGGYTITDATTTWEDLLGTDPRWNSVPTYVHLKVKMIFDPPSTGFLTTAMKDNIAEMEERLHIEREQNSWVAPEPDVDEPITIILDGGVV